MATPTYRIEHYRNFPEDENDGNEPITEGSLARKRWSSVPYNEADTFFGDEAEYHDSDDTDGPRKKPVPPRPRSHMDNLPKPDETPENWYARIVGDYYRFLYATAYPIVRNAADAEDAVQTAVMNGLKRLDHLNDPRAIVSWLAMIVRNASLDVVRKRKRTAGGPGSADAEEIQVAADEADATFQMDDDQRSIVFAAVAELPESQAAVITLRHVEGLDIAELSERLDITPNNARVRLFRAYEKLRASPTVRQALGMDD
ncbi:sigma-70 family RNA polymerase sigma factor [Phycisphaeraceae bacterium D3-23]